MKRHALLLVLALLGGCSMDAEESDALVGTRWVLTSITDPELPIPPDQRYALGFHVDGLLGATVDCNGVGGTYRVYRNGRIDLDLITSTYVGCGPESLDDEVSRLIVTSSTYELRLDRLILRTSGSDRRTLVFIAEDDSNAE